MKWLKFFFPQDNIGMGSGVELSQGPAVGCWGRQSLGRGSRDFQEACSVPTAAAEGQPQRKHHFLKAQPAKCTRTSRPLVGFPSYQSKGSSENRQLILCIEFFCPGSTFLGIKGC